MTVSEDNQPLLPRCPRMWAAPGCSPIQPPTSSLSLDHSSLCLLQHYCTTKLERGGMLYDMSHINRLRGGAAVLVCTRTHTLSYCTLLSMQLPLPHILTHRHTHTQNAAHTQKTPCGGFGNPSSDPNVSAQSRTKAHHHRLLLNPQGRVPFLPVCSTQD